MTLREIATDAQREFEIFWWTIQNLGPMDWPISYLIYVGLFGFAGVLGLAMIPLSISIFIHDKIDALRMERMRVEREAEDRARKADEAERSRRHLRALHEHEKWRAAQKNSPYRR